MGQINVKGVDIKYPGADSVKSKKDTQNVSDDFKKLLKDQPKEQNEISEGSGQIKKEPEDVKDLDDSTKDANTAEAAAQLQLGQMMYQVQNIPVQETPAVEGAAEMSDAGLEAVEGLLQNEQTAELPVQQGAVPAEKNQNIQMPQEEGADQLQPAQAEAVLVQPAESSNTQTQDQKSSSQGDLAKDSKMEKTAGREMYENAQEGAAVQPAQPAVVHSTASEARTAAPEKMHVNQPEEIPQKLTEELLVKTANGVSEFEIEIEPANLGKIAIKVLYEGGQTMVSILCSEKKTLEMIGQNAREIGVVMEQNLGSTTTVIVEKEETDYLHQGENENDHSGREAEQDRQREENEKEKARADSAEQFLQKLRLGLAV